MSFHVRIGRGVVIFVVCIFVTKYDPFVMSSWLTILQTIYCFKGIAPIIVSYFMQNCLKDLLLNRNAGSIMKVSWGSGHRREDDHSNNQLLDLQGAPLHS